MRRSKTVAVSTSNADLDFSVVEFTSHDDSVLTYLGKHCKESKWKISLGPDSKLMEVKISVDKQIASSHEVTVTCDDEKVFPEGNVRKSKLAADFEWVKPFRGALKGLNVKDYFLVRPTYVSREEWFLATLTEQTDADLFKAILQMPDGHGGFNGVEQDVKLENVKEAGGKHIRAALAQRSLQLFIPRDNPLDAVLNIDGEAMTHFFARPTPPLLNGSPGRSTVTFKVSKDRKEIKTDIGHSAFSHFQSSEPRSVSSNAEELKHSWTFQGGPFAEHSVVISKEKLSSHLVKLEVDGTVLVESGPEEIESPDGLWECHFQLVGERTVEWEVYESDGDGGVLDTTGKVIEKSKYSHNCSVRIDLSAKDLITAKLFINESMFQDLPEARTPNEASINIDERGLQALGLKVPYKIAKDATIPATGFMANFNKAVKQAEKAAPPGFFDLFSSCCSAPSVVGDDRTDVSPAPAMSQ